MKRLIVFVQRLIATAPDPRIAKDMESILEAMAEIDARLTALEQNQKPKSGLILP